MNESNLPPGVTSADIEAQAHNADVEAALETIIELADEYDLDTLEMIKAFSMGAAIMDGIKSMTERALKLKVEEDIDAELL